MRRYFLGEFDDRWNEMMIWISIENLIYIDYRSKLSNKIVCRHVQIEIELFYYQAGREYDREVRSEVCLMMEETCQKPFSTCFDVGECGW